MGGTSPGQDPGGQSYYVPVARGDFISTRAAYSSLRELRAARMVRRGAQRMPPAKILEEKWVHV